LNWDCSKKQNNYLSLTVSKVLGTLVSVKKNPLVLFESPQSAERRFLNASGEIANTEIYLSLTVSKVLGTLVSVKKNQRVLFESPQSAERRFLNASGEIANTEIYLSLTVSKVLGTLVSVWDSLYKEDAKSRDFETSP